MQYVIYVLAVLLLCAGCTQQTAEANTIPTDTRNFTLVFQCADTPNLSIRVTGNAFVNMPDLARSRCSMHVQNGTVRLQCPGAGLQASTQAERGREMLEQSRQQAPGDDK